MEIEITENELTVLEHIENINQRKTMFALLAMYKSQTGFLTIDQVMSVREAMQLDISEMKFSECCVGTADDSNDFLAFYGSDYDVALLFAEINCGIVRGKVDADNLLAEYNKIFPELFLCDCGDYYTKNPQATKQKCCKNCSEIIRKSKANARVKKHNQKLLTLPF